MPEWITNFKKEKGQSITKIGNNYYLYQVSSVWDKDKKRAKKITNSYIGKITEKGLIKKKIRSQEQPFDLNKVAIKDYGLYAFLENDIHNMKENLLTYFKDEVIVEKIITIALIKLSNQSPFKRIEHHYKHSYISEVYKNLNLNKDNITPFLRNLGERRTDMVSFMKSNILFNSWASTQHFSYNNFDCKGNFICDPTKTNPNVIAAIFEDWWGDYYSQYKDKIDEIRPNANIEVHKMIDCYNKDLGFGLYSCEECDECFTLLFTAEFVLFTKSPLC